MFVTPGLAGLNSCGGEWRIEESFQVAIGFLRIKFKHFINLDWCGAFASFDLIRPVIISVMIIKSYGQPAALGTWDETLRSLRRSRTLGGNLMSRVDAGP